MKRCFQPISRAMLSGLRPWLRNHIDSDPVLAGGPHP